MIVDPNNSEIDEITRQAYWHAHYKVFATEPFVLRIGVRSLELAALYEFYSIESAAFLTACNPLGVLCSDEENLSAQSQLHVFLYRLGLMTLPGLGRDPSGAWPGEASFLALGISAVEACSLGMQFKQNAIVWAGRDAVPSLLLLR